VLAQQIRERLVGEFLIVLQPILGEKIEGVPRLLGELDALAGHRGILLRDNSATLWQFPGEVASRYRRP
jgi:hypothetical protein